MAMKLTIENIYIIENRMLDETDIWEGEAERAKMVTAYIEGIHDMANAVREVIRELGGK